MNSDERVQTSVPSQASSKPSLFDQVYPPALREKEVQCGVGYEDASSPKSAPTAVTNGGQASPPSELPDGTLGLAFSGGGIRSATFCLGFLQSLARSQLFGKVRFLSTVSGGGYIGSFLGALFSRRSSLESVREELANPASTPVRWLRENGRYLAPNGSGDLLTALAVQVRNWVSVVVVIGLFALMLFLGFNALRGVLENGSLCGGFLLDHFPLPTKSLSWWWSPSLLPAGVGAALAVVFGACYWLIPRSQARLYTWPMWMPAVVVLACLGLQWGLPEAMAPYRTTLDVVAGVALGLLALWLGSLFWALAFWIQRAQGGRRIAVGDGAARLAEAVSWQRRFFSGALARLLLITFAVLGFGLLDSLGQSLYLLMAEKGGGWVIKTLLPATGLATVFSLGPKLAPVARLLSSSGGGRVPLSVWAVVLSLGCLGLFLLSLNLLGHAIAWEWASPRAKSAGIYTELVAVAFGICLVLSALCGRDFSFLNRSSLQLLYGSRLARAYLGASNPARQKASNQAITELIPGDDIYLDAYRPQDRGGPLHLINLTFNETCSAKSNIEQRDRKGLQFAVGPCGLSVGRSDHALWAGGEDRRRGSIITPVVPSSNPDRFVMFPSKPGSGRTVENISIGHWVALSGAAFGTGLGFRTRLGLSLLAGLSNVRLGYWWDSKVQPRERPKEIRSRTTLWQKCGSGFAWLFPVQSHLLDEWLARFHGPARRYWYLSDGGHFENTGVYELIRRRVPYIVCCDCGADPGYRFEDVANLVRKARVDFQTEVRFLSRLELNALKDNPIPPAVWERFGTAEEFRTPNNQVRPHALLAVARYADEPTRPSLLLFVKPALSGDEPLDVSEYQLSHTAFPNEPTTDQFFDEAQWESYRKLGEHSGDAVLPAAGAKPWWFTQIDPRQFQPLTE